MSYCRFSELSDVYLYPTSDGIKDFIVCCQCSLENPQKDFKLKNLLSAKRHLEKHLSFSHKVPKSAFDRLEREITEKEKN